MSRIRYWRCAKCGETKARSCFGEISRGCLCRECQSEVTAIGATPVMPAHEARVRARRVFRTPREQKFGDTK